MALREFKDSKKFSYAKEVEYVHWRLAKELDGKLLNERFQYSTADWNMVAEKFWRRACEVNLDLQP